MDLVQLRLRDVVLAGVVGGVVAGAPSTAHALLTRRSPIEATLAAGTLLLPRGGHPVVLALAAIPVHAALSVGWAGVLAATLPRRFAVSTGAAAGLAIAAVDLGIVGRRFPRIRALPLLPQVADHVAFGLAVGWMLDRRPCFCGRYGVGAGAPPSRFTRLALYRGRARSSLA